MKTHILVCGHQHLAGTCCLHLQSRNSFKMQTITTACPRHNRISAAIAQRHY